MVNEYPVAANAADLAADLVAAAVAAGADAADVLYVRDAATQVSVRLGVLDDVQRSDGEEIGLRLFIGRRSASVSSSDLSKDAMRALVDRAVAMAREAPEDPYAGLAPAELLATGAMPDVDIDDGGAVGPAELKARALEAEDVARSVPGITNSEGGSASGSRATIALATSTGFAREYATTAYGCSASVIAGAGGVMQRDYASHSARHLVDLEAPATIGRRAADRTIARLNPTQLPSGRMPVVFDPRVSAGLLGPLIGAITGAAIARRTSFLLDAMDTQLFAPGIRVVDDPHRVRGLRSRPFDGEGLPTAARDIVHDGRLTGWIADSASARQLGMQPTGHASRGIGGSPGAGTTNLHLAAGTLSVEALIADIVLGVWVIELIGSGVNGLTGDYSRGAAGFAIRNGQLAEPVAEVTIAGNLKTMYRELVPASDLLFRAGTNAPTVRIDGMTVAGA
ncbi:TldD/PmbA family protein [Sphingomonas montana]|uniref:TldD/PmbA family protein n=1 Tax=Sphingomonas montana TaxID=1843236 RepID=UPI00096E9B0B|nr:metallopeptidase TldD-related protein [Sphingomonas montana]